MLILTSHKQTVLELTKIVNYKDVSFPHVMRGKLVPRFCRFEVKLLLPLEDCKFFVHMFLHYVLSLRFWWSGKGSLG